MALLRILDGKFMQPKFPLHGIKLSRLRVLERHPDKTSRLIDEQMNLADGNIRELPAVLVGNAVDQHK